MYIIEGHSVGDATHSSGFGGNVKDPQDSSTFFLGAGHHPPGRSPRQSCWRGTSQIPNLERFPAGNCVMTALAEFAICIYIYICNNNMSTTHQQCMNLCRDLIHHHLTVFLFNILQHVLESCGDKACSFTQISSILYQFASFWKTPDNFNDSYLMIFEYHKCHGSNSSQLDSSMGHCRWAASQSAS